MDNAGQKQTAQFDDMGNIKGFEKFTSYFVEEDFGQGPGADSDQVRLYRDSKNHDLFIFKRDKDTLKLFSYVYDDSLYKYENIKLAYKLIKQK